MRDYIKEAEDLESYASNLEYEHQKEMRNNLLCRALIFRELAKEQKQDNESN
jgi:hypothetical protein